MSNRTDPSRLGHFHSVTSAVPVDGDDVLYMLGYDMGTVDAARHLAGQEPEVSWFPFVEGGARATTLDGFMAFIAPREDGYTWWVDSPRTGTLIAMGSVSDIEDGMVAAEEQLARRRAAAPLNALVAHILRSNPIVEPARATQIAKKAQNLAWTATGAEMKTAWTVASGSGDFPWNRRSPTEKKPIVTDPKIEWKWLPPDPGDEDVDGGIWSWNVGTFGSATPDGIIVQAIIGCPVPGDPQEWRIDVSGRRIDGYDMEVGFVGAAGSAEEAKRIAEQKLLPLWAADRYAD
jgi:hypothetical protein